MCARPQVFAHTLVEHGAVSYRSFKLSHFHWSNVVHDVLFAGSIKCKIPKLKKVLHTDSRECMVSALKQQTCGKQTEVFFICRYGVPSSVTNSSCRILVHRFRYQYLKSTLKSLNNFETLRRHSFWKFKCSRCTDKKFVSTMAYRHKNEEFFVEVRKGRCSFYPK